jgi:hypothetical protein
MISSVAFWGSCRLINPIAILETTGNLKVLLTVMQFHLNLEEEIHLLSNYKYMAYISRNY